MINSLVIKDPKGLALKYLIIYSLLYSNLIQQRIIVVPYMLQTISLLVVVIVLFDKKLSLFWKYISKGFKFQIGFYILILPIGLITSPKFSDHLNQCFQCYEYIIITLSMLYYSITRNSFDFILNSLVLLFLIMCLIFTISPVMYSGVEGKAQYSLGYNYNPNTLALNLNLCLWILLFNVSRNKINYVLVIPFIVMLFRSVILTGSRKGFIAFLICIALWIATVYIPLSNKKIFISKILRMIVIIITVSYLYVMFIPIYLNSRLAFRMRFLSDEAYGGIRNDMYRVAIDLFKRSPIIGHGMQSFQHYYYGLYSHSTISEVLVSGGLLCGTIYFLSLLYIAKSLFSLENWSKQNHIYGARIQARMGCILLILMLFYAFGIVHIYSLSSFICLAIITLMYSVPRSYFEVSEMNIRDFHE